MNGEVIPDGKEGGRMTPEQRSREICSIIAEKVMLWNKVEVPEYAGYADIKDLPRPCFWETEFGVNCITTTDPEQWEPKRFAPYKNKEDAFLVVDKINEREDVFFLSLTYSKNWCFAKFIGRTGFVGEGTGETVPSAICSAILGVIGEEGVSGKGMLLCS
jgi:hypothetical protein